MVEVFNQRSAQYSLLLCLGVEVPFFQLSTLGKALCEWEGGYGTSRSREPLAVWVLVEECRRCSHRPRAIHKGN